MDTAHSGNPYTFDYLRSELIGRDAAFETPFGSRHIFYADFTASGRGLHFIQQKLIHIQRSYANTHSEDDYSGRYLTNLLKQAERRIKECVGAGPEGKVVAVGSGATGALKHLQEMIGVYIPPVTKEKIYGAIEKLNCEDCTILEKLREEMPVVFIGPYEHHTNELMWREAFAEVHVVPLAGDGTLDLEEMERMVSDPAFKDRTKFGSFSAGSNITGIKTDVYQAARICHAHGTKVFFDFAAAAPYVEIDMNRDGESYFDAIFFSPHKFIGGPGSAGILVFREELYRSDLPPTTAGGGTVDFVGYEEHDFSGIELIGNVDAEDRIAIVSFNIRHDDRFLHPKFVTRLMNDLFGIQSRAGCSCAGPYGHALLHIDSQRSEKHRALIQRGICGIKPGWVRINLHYLFSREDIQFLLDAIEFIAVEGKYFLPLYSFHIDSGEWNYSGWDEPRNSFSLDDDFLTRSVQSDRIQSLRDSYMQNAQKLAEELKGNAAASYRKPSPEIEELQYFYYIEG